MIEIRELGSVCPEAPCLALTCTSDVHCHHAGLAVVDSLMNAPFICINRRPYFWNCTAGALRALGSDLGCGYGALVYHRHVWGLGHRNKLVLLRFYNCKIHVRITLA